MIRIALDSNVLVYLAGTAIVDADRAKITRARDIVRILREKTEVVVPVQALGELFVVMQRHVQSPSRAREFITEISQGFETQPSVDTTLASALDLAVDHRLQFWDSLILSATAEAGCSLLLSEDMQDGFVTRGVTIANPFAEKLHPRLARLLT